MTFLKTFFLFKYFISKLLVTDILKVLLSSSSYKHNSLRQTIKPSTMVTRAALLSVFNVNSLIWSGTCRQLVPSNQIKESYLLKQESLPIQYQHADHNLEGAPGRRYSQIPTQPVYSDPALCWSPAWQFQAHPGRD